MKIKYERLFRLGDFENERIGIELDIPDTADPQENLLLLKQEVHQFFEKQNPAYGIDTKQYEEEPTKDPIQAFIDEIDKCNTIEQLDQFKYLKNSSKPKLKQHYENKLKELSKPQEIPQLEGTLNQLDGLTIRN